LKARTIARYGNTRPRGGAGLKIIRCNSTFGRHWGGEGGRFITPTCGEAITYTIVRIDPNRVLALK
jgi:hypothetical protein